MKIHQAAELAGITSKNIRFYEDQGLITPARDSGNGYRDYSMEDVEQLCRIKLLRMLGISCEDIRRLQSGDLDFDACMDDRMTDMRRRKTGAIISAIAIITFLVLILGTMLYFDSSDPAPKGVIAFFIIVGAVMAIAVGYVLKQRLDEVRKGEIDEASKY